MILYVVIGIIVLIAIYAVSQYNSFVKLNNMVKEAFSTMDVYMKKRWDLIPKLVEIVKGYAKHEKGALEQITKLRNSEYSTMSNNQKIQTNSELAQVLTKFMAVAENYPNLKADQHFLQLSRDLSSIETDIANSRKYYNGTVRLLNNFLEMFPTNIIGFIFGIKKEKMFEISDTERQNIEVNGND